MNFLRKTKPGVETRNTQLHSKKIKGTYVWSLSLTHYHPNLDTNVASDANSNGIGACILHKLPNGTRKAITHASRSLLPAEK